MCNLKDKIGKELLIFDGAMGTQLQEKGLKPGEIPELMCMKNAEAVYDIHASYLKAGSDIIFANTFGANRIKLSGNADVEKVISEAIKIAKKAVKDIKPSAYVALDIGPTGKLLKPYGTLEFEDAYNTFAEMASAGEKAGADLIVIETMSDTYEVKAALLAAKENSSLPVIVMMTFDEGGKMLTGGDIPSAVTLVQSLGADAVGTNCGLGPQQIEKLLPEFVKWADIPVVVKPNAGFPEVINGKTVYNLGVEEFSESIKNLAENGACIVGGCCGTDPRYIAAVKESCRGIVPKKTIKKNRTAVSSYCKTVVFGEAPVVIGERLNPTGKPRLKEALKSENFDYIYNEAIQQAERGAEVLDINVGLPGIDEADMMRRTVCGVQSVTELPLQIDTSLPEAMERAMRVYNGRPLINSVNGKEESMETVLPLVKKYGACVVALTLDENGIPETAEGRIKIAEKIIKRAAEYGIKKEDILVDTLTMTVSTGKDNGKITLDALNYVRNTLGVNTVLGVSNISFGLPQREMVTSAFLAMAISNGLSGAIINPMSPVIMNAFYSASALIGQDDNCCKYIENVVETGGAAKAGEDKKASASSENSDTLGYAIEKGLLDGAEARTKELLKTKEPMEIIEGDIIPALDKVGVGFEKNTIFLPQLLMSADAAKKAFDVIKAVMPENSREKKGRVIIATVKGDIHDIGKNIVKVMLENYGYEVVDLGKDVAPEAVLSAAKKENIRLVGLSALMTTTVTSMEETIKLLQKELPDCKVMVGGAVMNREYADSIGADFYGKDAMSSVRYADSYFESIKD